MLKEEKAKDVKCAKEKEQKNMKETNERETVKAAGEEENGNRKK